MSTALTAHIQQLINKSAGKLPFSDFMHAALYTPDLGYYCSSRQILGHHGDFTTAPESSSLFGQCISRRISQVFTQIDNADILEFGAGSGRLCVDILSALEQSQCLPEHYYIIEVSAHLKARQQQLIEENIPHLAEKVSWLSSWPQTPIDGVIIANEVLDAMPVELVRWQQDTIKQGFVSIDADNKFELSYDDCHDQRLLAKAQQIKPGVDNYCSEINLFIDDWLKQCYHSINKGLVILCDYGFVASEYYHPDRKTGTLMCHYQHQAHPDPLINIGDQDITAHVDFSEVAESSHNCGFDVIEFTNQAGFLLANGLLELLESKHDSYDYITLSQQAKLLTSPAEMGELFKVISLGKEIDLFTNALKDMRFML